MIAALMLPRAVFTHLKAGVFAARGPEPVLTSAWLHPAPVTAAKQARPSLTTVEAGSRLCLAKALIEVLRKPVTRLSFRRTGLPVGVVSTAATKGVLPAAPSKARRPSIRSPKETRSADRGGAALAAGP